MNNLLWLVLAHQFSLLPSLFLGSKMPSRKYNAVVKSRFMILFWIFIFVAPVSAAQSDIEVLDVVLPSQMVLAKTQEKLTLNGYGVHSSWGEQLYVAALYTKKAEKRDQMLLANDDPIAMIFYFVQDDISAQMLIQLFTESIIVNNGGWGNAKLDKKRIMELQSALEDPIHAGDVLAFHYSPTTGILLLLNGKELYHWSYAKSFFNMLLRMWIGQYPPSRAFKQGILGFPVKRLPAT